MFITTNALKKMLLITQAQLDIVFISACHSEGVATAFLEAGATHVICIKKENQVLDEACVLFSRVFYEALFGDNRSPCEAFYIATSNLSISKGLEAQASLFSIRVNKDHKCQAPFVLPGCPMKVDPENSAAYKL